MKEGLNFKQKCISTIVSVNDGRLDSLTLGQLYKIVKMLLAKEKPTNIFYSLNGDVEILDIDYISVIIDELLEIE